MNKIFNFLNRYGVIIIILLLLIISMRNCAINSNVKKTAKKQAALIEALDKKVDSLSAITITKKELQIEGLKNEKRALQFCDRKKWDLDREKEIDIEIKELEKQ